MLMMTSQISKSVDFTKQKKKAGYLGERNTFLPNKKFINYTSRATLLQKIVL